MFRIFLRKKLLTGDEGSPANPDSAKDHARGQRNRRLNPRFDVDQKHLTVMNDQDILVIRDLSPKGFSSDVSPRAYRRFQLNDVYDARMRYLGEMHDMSIKVAWKDQQVVGFELCQAEPETLQFFNRLLRPVRLANSLTKVEAAFMRENEQDRTWYHGDDGTDLMIWRSSQQKLEAWQLVCGEVFVEWDSQNGLRSGLIRQDNTSQSGILKSTDELIVRDSSPNPDRLRFATDLLMAFRSQDQKEILPTIVDFTEANQ